MSTLSIATANGLRPKYLVVEIHGRRSLITKFLDRNAAMAFADTRCKLFGVFCNYGLGLQRVR